MTKSFKLHSIFWIVCSFLLSDLFLYGRPTEFTNPLPKFLLHDRSVYYKLDASLRLWFAVDHRRFHQYQHSYPCLHPRYCPQYPSQQYSYHSAKKTTSNAVQSISHTNCNWCDKNPGTCSVYPVSPPSVLGHTTRYTVLTFVHCTITGMAYP